MPHTDRTQTSNIYLLDGIWHIALTQDQVAFIDGDDIDLISDAKWMAAWVPSRKTYYAIPSRRQGQGGRQYMHRLILGDELKPGQTVEHINGNTLDNRRANLRIIKTRRGSQPGPREQARKGNEIIIDGETAKMRLSNKEDLYTLIDIHDIDKVHGRTWYGTWNPDIQGHYAITTRFVHERDGGPAKLYLHRFLMDAPSGMTVDHINHNTLDNRRANLRIVPNWQNTVNRKQPSALHTHSGVRGVSVYRSKWGGVYYMARVQVARYFPYTEEGLQEASACAQELRQRVQQLADEKLTEGLVIDHDEHDE